MTGWGKRSFNWEFTTSVQQELLPRVSLDVQYARRWYGNIRVMDDKAVTPADYSNFSIPVPSDLGGGTLTGITVRPDAPAPSYFITLSDNYGKMTEHFDGVNITVNARLMNGLLLQGGTGSGRQKLNDCEIVDDLPEMGHTFFGDPTRAFFFAARPKEFCETNNGWRTSLQGLAAYTLPKIDLQISGTWQNLPGAVVQANANYSGIPGFPGVAYSGPQYPFIPFQASRSPNRGRSSSNGLKPDRPAAVEDFPLQQHEDGDQLRLLQRDQLELGAQRERRLRRRRCRLENTDDDPAAAHVQDRRAVRLLEGSGLKAQGSKQGPAVLTAGPFHFPGARHGRRPDTSASRRAAARLSARPSSSSAADTARRIHSSASRTVRAPRAPAPSVSA
jgi:hypothetical protein